MARTGKALLGLLVAAPALAADIEFHMSASRGKVGTEDTFRVEIVVGNAPEGAVLEFPPAAGFEILSRSQSTQSSYSLGFGTGAVARHVKTYTLMLRANRPGQFTIAPARLKTDEGTYETESIPMEAVAGRLAEEEKAAPPANPFGFFPGLPDMDSPFEDDARTPPDAASLFLRSQIDAKEVYIGQQVMLSLYVYARVNLMSVDALSMPTLEGFLSQGFKSPSKLRPEETVFNGQRYHRYLLRKKVLFPLKAGEFTIGSASADITTGGGFFGGKRLRRRSNPVQLRVKPLPPGGEGSALVGAFRLRREVSASEVQLGAPVQLRFILEGVGNITAAQLPPLQVPAGLKTFAPEVSDKQTVRRNKAGGKRTVEYMLVPQKTGSFTLPGLVLPYFNPETRRWEKARAEATTLKVRPGAAVALGASGAAGALGDGQKNQLLAGGLKGLRHSAHFRAPRQPLWRAWWFLPVALGPGVLGIFLGAAGALRQALGGRSLKAQKKRQARAARRRLALATKRAKAGTAGDFYAEVASALHSFLEARLGAPVSGLSRLQLDAHLAQQDVSEGQRQRLLAVFEACDVGRYAPGMADTAARRRTLEEASLVMEAWG